ncbi:Uma2 family endonuclease [Solihabitans fulvus]|uniref:Uma2 family endonuclease n=1 Tax=Solihabitans fulvus TaxID=1892852 RepID=UPI001CB761C7|nr:Uma2 family endonuclease [Solihabitans fulvus]
MSAALQHPIGPNTVEDWLTAEHPSDGSRLELIWGYFHVSPAPSGQHQHAGFALARLIFDAVRDAKRTDLHVVPAVGVEISSAMRTALIPDVVVLDTKPVGVSFHARNVVLAAEIWSPGNTRSERETKVAAYATAGVPFFWAVDQDRIGTASVTAYRLERGRYVEDTVARPGRTTTITAAPVPVAVDPAELCPR